MKQVFLHFLICFYGLSKNSLINYRSALVLIAFKFY